jgi:hypothetical protein
MHAAFAGLQMALKTAALVATSATLTACATTAQQETPARLQAPSEAVRAELLDTVRTALNSSAVTLAAAALTTESTLTIERTPLRDDAGRRVTGRDHEMPEHFQLVKSGARCILIHVRTQARYGLKQATCVAADR